MRLIVDERCPCCGAECVPRTVDEIRCISRSCGRTWGIDRQCRRGVHYGPSPVSTGATIGGAK